MLDRETGANPFVLPVHHAEYLTGHEITDDQGDLLCLVLAACEQGRQHEGRVSGRW